MFAFAEQHVANFRRGFTDFWNIPSALVVILSSLGCRYNAVCSVFISWLIFAVTECGEQVLLEFLGVGDYFGEVFCQLLLTYPHIICSLILSSAYYEEIVAKTFLLLRKEPVEKRPLEDIRIQELEALYAIGPTIITIILVRPIPYYIGFGLCLVPLSCLYSFFALHGKFLLFQRSPPDILDDIESRYIYYTGHGITPAFLHLIFGRRFSFFYFMLYPILILTATINHELESAELPNFYFPIFHFTRIPMYFFSKRVSYLETKKKKT